jgi:predicted nucleotidyltransferase
MPDDGFEHLPKKVRADIKHIVDRLVSDYSPERILLYGSFLQGIPRSDSDLDLLVIKSTKDRFLDRWVTVRSILSDPHRKLALDIIVLTPEEVEKRLRAKDQFIASVLKRGRTLYAA